MASLMPWVLDSAKCGRSGISSRGVQMLWTLLCVGTAVVVTVLPGAAAPVANRAGVRLAQPPGALSIAVSAATTIPGSSISRELGEVRVSTGGAGRTPSGP